MEDDSDWDVNLKSQMLEFARGTRALQAASKNQTSPTTSFSPYGDDWDMLWLGHCGMNSLLEAHDQDRDHPSFYVIPDDPTVRPLQHKAEFVRPRLSERPEFEEHTRLVFIGEGPICSWSLAFTYEGARKALAALSFIGVDEPVDLGYNFLCSGILNVPYTCYSTYPSLMGTWQQQGSSSRDSDIADSQAVDLVDDWHEASSRSLVYSTMLNLMRLVRNESTVKPQWEDVSPGEVDLGRLEIPEGYLYENAL